jgi:hypothetical protein
MNLFKGQDLFYLDNYEEKIKYFDVISYLSFVLMQV